MTQPARVFDKSAIRGCADLFAVQVRKNRAGLPRLSFRFRDKAIAPNTTWKPTFDV